MHGAQKGSRPSWDRRAGGDGEAPAGTLGLSDHKVLEIISNDEVLCSLSKLFMEEQTTLGPLRRPPAGRPQAQGCDRGRLSVLS